MSGPAEAPVAGRQHCALCGGERFDRTLAAFDRQVARSETYAYGRCTECGEEIPLARLQVFPETATCVNCTA